MDILATRLKKLIEENKITRYKLAKDLKYGKATVLNWCDGINEPKATQIAQIAIYFDVSADYLLGLEDESGAKTYINNSFNNFNNNGNFKI